MTSTLPSITLATAQWKYPMEVMAPPVKLSKTPASVRTAAPEFNQHTEEVLLEAGYTWEEIERFSKEGIIA
jgi:crotonobetainyl-CoA:carnitine CoA-transferase CaiB-like acyl-CoA transferase